jgi:hypothetical protein
MLVSELVPSCGAVAMPKSISFAGPSPSMTFAGLTSQWTSPRSWTTWSAANSSRPIRSTSSRGSRPRSSRIARSDRCRSSSSMTM